MRRLACALLPIISTLTTEALLREDWATGDEAGADALLEADLFRRLVALAPEDCDLCNTSEKWLFLLATGRSGSTTTLDMMNTVEGITLAGENVDVIPTLGKLLQRADERAAQAADGRFGPGPVSRKSLLCAMQEYTRGIIGTFNRSSTKYIGFKDIRLHKDSMKLYDEIFPCARYIVQTRKNTAAQARSQARRWHGTLATVKSQTSILQKWYEKHSDASYGLQLENFSIATFNNVLQWLGVSGCQFAPPLIRANWEVRHKGAFKDAKEFVNMTGKCHVGTPVRHDGRYVM